MSQGQHGFDASRLSFESDRDSSFDDMRTPNSNVNHNSRNSSEALPVFENRQFMPTDYSGFSEQSPRSLRLFSANEVSSAPPAPTPQPSDSARLFGFRQSTQTPAQFRYPLFSIPSDSPRSITRTPAPPASSPYIHSLEDFKHVLPGNIFGQTSGTPPQPHFGYSLEPNHVSSPFTPLFPLQPSPSGPPYTISSFSQAQFSDGAAVQTYIGEVIWRPSMGMYGVPTTEAEKGWYVKKICMGLVNLSDIWDDPKDVIPYAVKFADTGIWSDSKHVEATAHLIVNHAMRIHKFGVTGATFLLSEEFESLNAEDIDFTFPQRIHFLTGLFWHSKVAADNVMSGRDIAKYVALPLTSLRRIPLFEASWSSKSEVDRKTEIVPYPPGLQHPTRAQQDQLIANNRLMPSLVNNYMATGGRLATMSQRYLSPNELAYFALVSSLRAAGKRSMYREEDSGMQPVAKYSRTSEHTPFDNRYQDPQDEDGRRANNAGDARYTAQGRDTEWSESKNP